MTMGARAVCLSALILFESATLAQGANINISIQLHRDTWSDGSAEYYAMPSVGYGPGASTLDMDSPTGWYGYHGGGSASSTSDPNDVITNVKGDWTVTLDCGLATQRVYTFNVDADAVNMATRLPAVVVTSIAHNQVLALPPTSIGFSNPGIFDWGYSNLYGPVGDTGNNMSVAADAVSLVLGIPITVTGNYNFNIQFYTNAAADVLFGSAVQTSGDPANDVFTFNATYASLGYRSFSVEAVPEPATLALLGLGLPLLLKLRRRK